VSWARSSADPLLFRPGSRILGPQSAILGPQTSRQPQDSINAIRVPGLGETVFKSMSSSRRRLLSHGDTLCPRGDLDDLSGAEWQPPSSPSRLERESRAAAARVAQRQARTPAGCIWELGSLQICSGILTNPDISGLIQIYPVVKVHLRTTSTDKYRIHLNIHLDLHLDINLDIQAYPTGYPCAYPLLSNGVSTLYPIH
jgi:hypothetical protein